MNEIRSHETGPVSASSAAEPSAPPRPAFRASAVVVLVRRRAGEREVFWVRRSDEVPYMPGFHAFVGGGVSRDDTALDAELAASPEPGGDPATADFDPDALRLLEACAIREAFEETGLLLGLDAPVDPGMLEMPRARLLHGEARFSQLAREQGWRFRRGALHYIGRWTTPPFAIARFDSAFFLAEVPEGQEPTVHPGELAMGEWIAPARAVERWKRAEAAIAAPILYTLQELDRGDERLVERLRETPRRAGVPVRRIELVWGVVLHPMRTRPLPPATHTNAYLVGERGMALVDPGSGEPAELDALFAVIDALAADGRKLEAVLVTHRHPDHVGGIDAVRERYHVPVLAHAETAASVHVDRMLEDGARVTLHSAAAPWVLRAIHTPGHAQGHLCFLEERTGSLFTGDHIVGGSGTVIVDPPEGDMAAYMASLERLLHEPVERLFPAHGSPQGGPARRIHGLIAHRLEREARVLAALDESPRALAELVERAYQDTARELWKYAERSLLAHLIKLEAEGKARRDGERWRRM